jgi:hypothetical protein
MARSVISEFPGSGVLSPASDANRSDAGVAKLFAALSDDDPSRYQFLLLFRFSLVNLAGLSLLGAAWIQGWIDVIVASDITYLCRGIFIVFLAGLAIAGFKAWQTSQELNWAWQPNRPASSRVAAYLASISGKKGDSRAILASTLRLKIFSRIGMVRNLANILVVLGLIGTVLGFIIALSGVQPGAATDPSAIAPMVTTLIEGMSVALYTTLVGAVLNVWLLVNFQVLAAGAVNLFTSAVELGERNAVD